MCCVYTCSSCLLENQVLGFPVQPFLDSTLLRTEKDCVLRKHGKKEKSQSKGKVADVYEKMQWNDDKLLGGGWHNNIQEEVNLLGCAHELTQKIEVC